MSGFKRCLSEFVQTHPKGKPLVLAIQDEGYFCAAERCARELREAGITVYPSLTRACRALKRFTDDHDLQRRRKG